MNYLRDGELLCPDDKTIRKELLKEARFYQVQGIITELMKKSSSDGDTAAENYAVYICKVLNQVHPDMEISKTAMGIMNSFVNVMFERIATEASRIALRNKKSIISSREIQSAVLQLLPDQLAKHADSEGTKALIKSTSGK